MKVVDLDPNDIEFPEVHIRKHKDDEQVTALADSIQREGLLHPLTVQPDCDGKYVLCGGFLRFEALCALGWKKIPCSLIDHRYPCMVSLVENMLRRDLDPLEKAKAFARCISEMGLTQKALADKLGKSEASISATLSLLDLPAEIIARHEKERKLSERQLLEILRLGSLETQKRAYEKGINAKSKTKAGKPVSVLEKIKNKAASLKQTLDQFDQSQVNAFSAATIVEILHGLFSIVHRLTDWERMFPNFDSQTVTGIIKSYASALRTMLQQVDVTQLSAVERTEFCDAMLSMVNQIAISGANSTDSDPRGVMQIVTSESSSIKKVLESVDVSHATANDVIEFYDKMLAVLIVLVRSQAAVKSFDPGSMIPPLRQFILILAQQCADPKAHRAFSKAIEQIASSVHKTCSTKFSVLKFWQRIAGWI